MDLALETYLLAPLIVVLAYAVFAISGFGSTLVAVPLLAHLLPIKFVVPLVLLLDFAGSTGMGLRFRANIVRAEITWLLPAILLGVLAGTALLLNAPPHALVLALGTLVTIYGTYTAFAGPARGIAPRWLGLALGFAGGTMASSIGAGGPLYMIYLSRRIADKTSLRSTMSAVVVANTALRIVIFLIVGLFLQEGLLLLALMLLPFILVGLFIGHRLHLRLAPETVMKAVSGLLVAAGVSLVLRALGSP